MLLYIIEGAVPLLTITLVWAGYLAFKKNVPAHKKMAIFHAVTTWLSYIVVMGLVRMGFSMGENAPAWIMNIHLAIIYTLPPMLVALMILGLKGARKLHITLASIYALLWIAALVTGAMIFFTHRGWL